MGSLTASSQQKPPQRGGDPDNGGKGVDGNGKGGRGSSSSINDNAGRIPRPNTQQPQQSQQIQETQQTQETQEYQNPQTTPLGESQGSGLRDGDASLSNIYHSQYREEAQQFLNYFFNNYRTEIFNNTQFNASALPNFNYYVRMFNAIQQHGGCISIDDFNGPDGSAANNSEWLTAMIESGQFSIEMFNTDAHGNITLSGVGVDSDQNLLFASTTQIDKRAMAKAEAAYEHAMKVIDRKEKKIDNELNKIETERNALTKEYESVKKVSEENIERTFGLFS